MAEEARLLLETLSELRVVDLKRELEKRRLSKSGSKKDLCERLRTHLKLEELRLKGAEQTSDPISSLTSPAGDAGVETNEFVKSYLEQREILLEKQMEQKKKYQEETYRSQESESQSEAEDLSQHQHNVNLSKDKPQVQTIQEVDEAECVEIPVQHIHQEIQPIKITLPTRPEYDSDTDEDTEDEGGNYVVEPVTLARDVAKKEESPEKNVAVVATNDDDTCSVADDEVIEVKEAVVGDGEVDKKIDEAPQDSAVVNTEGGQRDTAECVDDTIAEKETAEHVDDSMIPDEEATDQRNESRDREEDEDAPILEKTDEVVAVTPELGHDQPGCVVEDGDKDNENGEEVVREESLMSIDEETVMSATAKMDDVTSEQQESKQDENYARTLPISEEPLEVMVQKEDEFDEVKVIDDVSAEKVSDKAERIAIQDEVTAKKVEPEVKVFSRKLTRNTQRTEEEKSEEMTLVEKPIRKRKWGTLEHEAQSVAISSDSLKRLLPEVMIDLSVPCDAMMDIIGGEEMEQDLSSKKPTHSSASSEPAASMKLARTIYQEVAEESTETTEPSRISEKELDRQRERRVVERKSMDEDMPERNVVMNRKESISTDSVAAGEENARKRRRTNSQMITVDGPVAIEGYGRELTPPRNPVSKFIHIFNLVRPYTLGQLKEILQRTGTLVDSGFWIDKIKSHCIVEYETSEQAVASRASLHGKKWPSWNPKILRVDFSDESELELMRNAKDGVVPVQRQRPDRMVRDSTTVAAATAVVTAAAAAAADAIKSLEPALKQEEVRKPVREAKGLEERLKDREVRRRREDEEDRKKQKENRVEEKQPPIREWDRNKVRASLEREKERPPNHRKRHSSGMGHEELESKRHKRADENNAPLKNVQKEEPPAKLLDDLFRKTKATPCIYWLPLTEEQIAEKEKHVQMLEAERLQRRAERDKKLEEEREERIKARAAVQREREGDRRRDF